MKSSRDHDKPKDSAKPKPQSRPKQKSAPRLKRIDQLAPSSVAIEQTLVVLLEAFPAFSVIIAPHASAEPDDASLQLEDCFYLRRDEQGRLHGGTFPKVEIAWDPAIRHWIATPDGYRSIFLQPSAVPYAYIELSELTARAVAGAIAQSDFDAVFMMIRVRFGEFEGFNTDRRGNLKAPITYAAGIEHVRGRYLVVE